MRATWLVVLAVLVSAVPATAAVQPPTVSALAFYDYDRSLPLDIEQKQVEDTPAFTKYHLWYTSAHDQRVSAELWVPKTPGPHPAVIVQHGYGDSKDVDYVQGPAGILAGQGFVAIAIDAQYHGERARKGMEQALFNPASVAMRDAFVQTVIDQRRAVDVLFTRPEVDPKRIGYWGASMGGFLGAVFCGVEPRIKSVVLVVTGGGLAKRLGTKMSALATRAATVIEPANWVGMIAPRPLLMLNGTKDTSIPRPATELLYAAAREPKRIIWYESGHHDIPIEPVMKESLAHLGRM